MSLPPHYTLHPLLIIPFYLTSLTPFPLTLLSFFISLSLLLKS